LFSELGDLVRGLPVAKDYFEFFELALGLKGLFDRFALLALDPVPSLPGSPYA
jgi:hypothetical protein